MKWVLILGLAGWLPAAEASDSSWHFREQPLSELQLVSTRGGAALVEGALGEAVVAREGDFLGREQFFVAEVLRGCLALVPPDGGPALRLCGDTPGGPNS